MHACVHSTHFISLWSDTTIMPRHTPGWTVGAPPNSYLHAPPFIANLSPYYLLVTDTEFVAPPGLPGQLQVGMWVVCLLSRGIPHFVERYVVVFHHG